MSTPPPPLPPVPEPLEYARPAPPGERTPRLGGFGWGLFVWSLLLVLGWIAVLLLVVPRFQTVLADQKVALPLTTRALFTMRTIVQRGGWVGLALLPVALGVVAGRMSPGGRRALRMVVTLLFGLVLAWTILGIFQPLLGLVTAISSGR